MQQPSADQVRKQLRQIVASSVFANAERMRRFLEFVVEHTLRTTEEPLKEMIVGLELYAEGGDFDPRISSVVRVDAARLRTKLREYYAADGAADALVIDLPQGKLYAGVSRGSGQWNGPSGGGVDCGTAFFECQP